MPGTPLHLLQPAAGRRWSRTDPVLARLSRLTPLGPWPLARADPFDALVQAFCHQQVSMAAGAAIARRLEQTLGGAPTPRRVLAVGLEGLRAAGLSRAKAVYVQDLARKVDAGEVPFSQFDAWSDDDVLEALGRVRGIGPWTAKMFLLFHLQRPDVSCPEDLGLRLAVAQAYGVPPEAAGSEMEQRRAAWSPYNSVAARVLWQWRRQSMATP
ncbi:MAG TPA: DNA-3-methyladenine glycosylase 2 family protein [Candidatus Thermoplasmatota archaeon]|nr:DNA-3-methyladenine glycosylase 2 family protein [Candidatus Thermoplasmatota archaeon]